MALSNYQANAIKQIYGDKIINNKYTTVSQVENFYNDDNYVNAIELGDQMRIYSSYHGFTKYPLTAARTEDLGADVISRIGISQSIIDSHASYFKLLNDKDIDWDNAYLRYSNKYQKSYPELPINYIELIPELVNGKIQLNKIEHTTSDFLFERGITSYINNSYELMNTLDYLLRRIDALYFLFREVKKQHIAISNYKEQLGKLTN